MSVWWNSDRCKSCSRTVGREYAEFHAVDPPAKPFPLSVTSDGFFIASRKFRKFAIDNAFEGVEFVPLKNQFYVLKIAREVAYADYENFIGSQEDWCDVCRTFRRNLVTTAPRVISRDERAIGPLELVGSQERWGVELLPSNIGWTARHGDIVVGDAAAELLKLANFKGILLEEVVVQS